MKREFSEIRKNILNHLSKKPMERMELARALKCDYRTIQRHLIWLAGEEKIKKSHRNDKTYYTIV